MARRFYLSIVYDANGYDRYDILSMDSLQELDDIVANFNNRDEIIEHYLKDYHIDKKKGRVCIVYEDTDLKKKQLDECKGMSLEHQERLKRDFSYAHIIPILYNKRRLLSIEACLIALKTILKDKKVIDSIMFDKYRDGLVIKTNKRYLFETEEEQDLINNLCDYRGAVLCFLKRIKKANPADQYFYCRSLIDICKLSISIIKTKKGRILRRDKNMQNFTQVDIPELSESEILELETQDMDSFYLHHDLDEVIRLSPDQDKPIGSVGKRLR